MGRVGRTARFAETTWSKTVDADGSFPLRKRLLCLAATGQFRVLGGRRGSLVEELHRPRRAYLITFHLDLA
jgi:hypothetical protein